MGSASSSAAPDAPEPDAPGPDRAPMDCVDPMRVPLLLRATELLHTYGTPAHRLERVVVQLADTFGMRVQVFSTPTSIFLGFEDDVPAQDRVRLLRVEPGGVDLGKLVEIDDLLEDVEAREISCSEAIVRMDVLDGNPRRFSDAKSLVGHGLAAGTAAVFFGGGFGEVALSAVFGGLIGLLEIVSSRQHGVASIFEPLAALLAASGGLAAAILSDGAIDDRIVSMASIIVLLPGLSLTVALLELATRNLASGTARLAGVISVFLTIAFGAFAGTFLVRSAMGERPASLDGTSHAPGWFGEPWMLACTIVVASVGFALLFRARRKELPWIIGAGVAGFGAATGVAALYADRAEGELVDARAISAFAGALAVGVFANIYARYANRPATVLLLPGLLVLVPGSIGYRALSAFTEHNAVTGVEAVFQMMLIGVALVGGLLTANAVLPPRRLL